MRPYLAILLDSYRFAMSSRVLLMVLALISILLVVAAPAGYEEQLTTELLESDLQHHREFGMRLVERGATGGDSAEARVWERLPAKLRDDLTELARLKQKDAAPPDEQLKKDVDDLTPSSDSLRAALNEIIADRDFYSPNTWTANRLRQEAEDLLALGVDNLTDEQSRRLNRILLETSFRGLIQRGPRTSLRFYYLTSDTGFVQPMRKEELRELFVVLLPTILDSFILSIGLLIAIIATAWLIPQTFEPGTLSLQLSKPIRRWLMFLAKFGGGCIFAVICSTYLFVGFWLLLGFRWDIWEPGLLLCIPLYVFVFAMYYSVSALAALFWRSAIVSILVTGLFWGVCFVIGIAYSLMTGFLSVHENRSIIPVGNDLFAISNFNVPQRWHPDEREWQQVFLTEEETRHLKSSSFPNLGDIRGPVSIAPGTMMVARTTRREGILLGRGEVDSGYRLQRLAKLPALPIAIFRESDGGLLLINERGPFQRLVTEPRHGAPHASATPSDIQAVSEDEAPTNDTNQTAAAGPGLKNAGPALDLVLESPYGVAQDSAKDRIYLASGGRLQVFVRNAQRAYELANSLDLPGSPYSRVHLAVAGKQLVVGRSDGSLLILKANDLQLQSTLQPDGKNVIQQVAASPKGRWFAIRFANGKLWLYDTQEHRTEPAKVTCQGDVSAVAFNDDGNLLVSDTSATVMEYALPDETEVGRREPSRSVPENLYYYLIKPLHNYGPNPRVFDTTVQYVLSGKESVRMGRRGEEVKIDPLRPVWCGLAFIVVMLGIGCLYVERQEF